MKTIEQIVRDRIAEELRIDPDDRPFLEWKISEKLEHMHGDELLRYISDAIQATPEEKHDS